MKAIDADVPLRAVAVEVIWARVVRAIGDRLGWVFSSLLRITWDDTRLPSVGAKPAASEVQVHARLRSIRRCYVTLAPDPGATEGHKFPAGVEPRKRQPCPGWRNGRTPP